MPALLYEFHWDPEKDRSNLKKHGIEFGQAAAVFLDPLASTIPDEEHGEYEERWITLGLDAMGGHVLVVHTFHELAADRVRIRLISARRPTNAEVRSYEESR